MQDAQRDENVMTILEATLQQPPEQREHYLRLACEGNEELFHEIADDLNWQEQMGSFLLEPWITFSDYDRPFEPGQEISERFQIVRQIGEGGMGIVYEAFDAKRNQRIAIKAAKVGFRRLLSPELAGSLKVRHPNVCLVNEIHTAQTDSGEIDFLTMEFLEGETLDQRLSRDGAIEPKEALEIVRQLCAGLAEAHRSGVIHRDLKGSNVILSHTAEGQLRAVITDFGLARETLHGTAELAGTPQYMAPELWKGEHASKASDIYALGIVMYEIVTGRKPFEGESPELRFTSLPKAPSRQAKGLDVRWDAAIFQCLNVDPGSRPAEPTKILVCLEKKKRSKIPFVMAAFVALSSLIPGIREPIVQRIWPARVRLAILPFAGPPEVHVIAGGILQDLTDRLRRTRSGGTSIVVIAPNESSGNGVRTPEQAGRILHATHALEGGVRPEGTDLVAEADIVDIETQSRLRHFSARYSPANAGTMPRALAGAVSLALQLQEAVPREQLSGAASDPYLRALYFLRRDRRSFEEAIPLLQQAARADPRSPLPPAEMTKALLLKFRATQERKWLEEARRFLSASEALNPDSVRVLLAAGQLNEALGWSGKALEDYRRVHQIEPHNTEAFQGLAKVYDAMDLPEKATEAYRNAIKSEPEYYAPYLDFGVYYYYRGKYEQAVEQFRKAIERAPGLVQAYTNLGAALSDLGRDADAEQALLKSLKLKPTASALNSLGAVRTYQRRDAEATVFYRRALELDQRDYVILFNLGDAYRRTGRLGDSLATYRQAIEIAGAALKENPHRGYTRAFVGYFAARLGDRQGAEDNLSQALRLSPADQQVIRQAVLTYEALGERDQALETLQGATAEMLNELSRQPDLTALQGDPRFIQLKNAYQTRPSR